jgi:hypothetical protein
MNIVALLHLIPTLVAFAVMANPTLTGQALSDQVEGDVRHGLREYLDHTARIGWLVDVIWAIPSIKSQVEKAIAGALSSVEAASASPAAPQEFPQVSASGTVSS